MNGIVEKSVFPEFLIKNVKMLLEETPPFTFQFSV
jgi:hypothetical protein